jgi:hypothetical protein
MRAAPAVTEETTCSVTKARHSVQHQMPSHLRCDAAHLELLYICLGDVQQAGSQVAGGAFATALLTRHMCMQTKHRHCRGSSTSSISNDAVSLQQAIQLSTRCHRI